jgi:membrane protein
MTLKERPEELPRRSELNATRALRYEMARWSAAAAATHRLFAAQHAGYALLTEIVHEIQEEQPTNLAKQAAYSLLYAVPSILIVLVALAALVDKHTGTETSTAMQRFIAAQAPAELQPILASLVQYAIVKTSQSTAIVATVVSLAIAIWGGAGGIGALIYAINRAYGLRETRSLVRGTLLRVGLMLAGGFLVIAAFVLLAFGQTLGMWIAARAGRGSTLVEFLLSGPAWSFVLFFASLLLLYSLGLDVSKSILWLLPGTLAATFAVMVTFKVLGRLLSIANPGTPFGAAGSVLILLWALYLVSAIVVVGAIVNAVVGRRYDRTLIAALEQSVDRRTARRGCAA